MRKRLSTRSLTMRQEFREQALLASLCAVCIGIAYLLLPSDALSVGPRWLLLVIEAPCILLFLYAGYVRPLPHHIIRYVRLALTSILALSLLVSIILLVLALPQISKAGQLLKPALVLWVSNILVFALWYWETDGGGPIHRMLDKQYPIDFQFPQLSTGERTWSPGFVDYLFLAFCSSTALSPADTLPLTQRAKLLMMAQSCLSMLILVMLVARAVNIIA